MNILFPSDTKDVIDKIRAVIGRDVEFIIVASSIPCEDCSLDPIANTSTDSFCTTCSGSYWIPVYSGSTVSAHVTWGQADMLNWQSGGQLYDGDCRIQIEKTDSNMLLLDNIHSIVVDERIMEVKKTTFRGFQPLNRILIDLIEKDKDEE